MGYAFVSETSRNFSSGEYSETPGRRQEMFIYVTPDEQHVMTADWVEGIPKNGSNFTDAILVGEVTRFIARMQHSNYRAIMVPLDQTERLIKGSLSLEQFQAGVARIGDNIKKMQATFPGSSEIYTK